MEKIGVQAVVEGLTGFLGDMDKIDDSIRKLISPTNILGSTFEGLGNVFSNLLGGVFRTMEYALGTLIANAVMYVSAQIKELIVDTIEAGSEFQKLSLRLDTLNFNDLTEQQKSFGNAQQVATRQTKDQLGWLQRLANTTPYDNADISNVYTLARGYGFMDQEARRMTGTIIDFTSGMGLGNAEMVRIVKNFGQMQSLGKVMQRDLNDLATGAFVPVNRILEMMREETGLTGKAFDKFRNSAAGVDLFLTKFTDLVGSDFGGAAQKMARTFIAATDNVKDFVKSLGGLNIVKPVLDVLGGRIADVMDVMNKKFVVGTAAGADFINQFYEIGGVTTRFEQFTAIADRVGKSLAGIFSELLGQAPTVEGFIDNIIAKFDEFATWLEVHEDDIVGFVQGIVDGFQNDLVPAIEQAWAFLFGSNAEPGAIQKFGDWLKNDLMPFIKTQVLPGLEDLFDAITGKEASPFVGERQDQKKKGEEPKPTALEGVVASVTSLATALPSVLELIGAIGTALTTGWGPQMTEGPKTFAEFVTTTLIPAIQDLTIWVRENEKLIRMLVAAFIALEVMAIIAGIVISLTVGLASLVIGLVLFFATIGGIWAVTGAITIFGVAWEIVQNRVTTALAGMQGAFIIFKDIFLSLMAQIRSAITSGNWAASGKAIIDGIARGIKAAWNSIISMVKQLAQDALRAFNSIFKIKSPSPVMADVGDNIVQGLANGVSRSSDMAVKAMSRTAAAMLSAASPKMAYSMATTGPSQNTYQTNNNFNASFNSNTSNESLIQDFGMMASLVGA